MQEYRFVLTGLTPLLMHADDVEAADEMGAWRKDPKNKGLSVPGDDRSPAWTWQTYLYRNDGVVVIPQENLMTALRLAGSMIVSKGSKTFKSMSQSGLMMQMPFCKFTCNGEEVLIADIEDFKNEPFSVHKKEARELGFDLMVKRAKVGTSKHVRVRAKFDNWNVEGSILVVEPAITFDILDQMFFLAGKFAGLCDWRPSSKQSPGPYGMFEAKVSPANAGKRKG